MPFTPDDIHGQRTVLARDRDGKTAVFVVTGHPDGTDEELAAELAFAEETAALEEDH